MAMGKITRIATLKIAEPYPFDATNLTNRGRSKLLSRRQHVHYSAKETRDLVINNHLLYNNYTYKCLYYAIPAITLKVFSILSN